MRRPKTDQITHEQPLMCEWEEYCDWLEAQVEALREASQYVLEDVEHGPIGKTDLCLTQLKARLQEQEDEGV